VVLHGYETWSLTLREKNRVQGYESNVLKRMFEPKKDEMTGR
jgi:hypothetical protein